MKQFHYILLLIIFAFLVPWGARPGSAQPNPWQSLPFEEQVKPSNQKKMQDWMRQSVHQHIEQHLPELQCRGSLFSLGDPAKFDSVLSPVAGSQEYCVFFHQGWWLKDYGPATKEALQKKVDLALEQLDPVRRAVVREILQRQGIVEAGVYLSQQVGKHFLELYPIKENSTIPRKGPYLFPPSATIGNQSCWHEAQHALLFLEFPGNGHFARDLDLSVGGGAAFFNSIHVANGKTDDDGHHVFIEGYGERGAEAYERLAIFEKSLLELAEQEYQAKKHGFPLSQSDRERLYAPAGAHYREFLSWWDKVAPFGADPMTQQLVDRYTKATGIFFKPPTEVEKFYRDGNLKRSEADGAFPILVPESVFRGVRLLQPPSLFETKLGVGKTVRDQYTQSCRVRLQYRADGHSRFFAGSGPWGRVEFRLENPEENFTFIGVKQDSRSLPTTIANLIRVEGKGRSEYQLTFTHRALEKSRVPGPFRVRLSYSDTRTPSQVAPSEAEVLFQLPPRQSAVLKVLGKQQVAQGQELPLEVQAQFQIPSPPPVAFQWKDPKSGKEWLKKSKIQFSSDRPGDTDLEVVAVTADGKVVGSTTHKITVLGLPEVTIKGPGEALASEVFQLEAQVPASLKDKAKKFFWYRVDPTTQKREILHRMKDLIAVPELADPFQMSPQDPPTEDRTVNLQYYGAYKSHTYVVDACDLSNQVLATSKPFTVQEKRAYLETDVPARWSQQEGPSGLMIRLSTTPVRPPDPDGVITVARPEGLPTQTFSCDVCLQWGVGQRPTKDDGGTGQGLAGFRSRGSRTFYKGRASFSVEVNFSDRPARPVDQAAYDGWRKQAQAEVDTMLAHLRIVDHPANQKSKNIQVRLEAKPDITNPKPGQLVNVTARVDGVDSGDQPLQFRWTGNHEGQGASVRFMATEPGDYPLQVVVAGKNGYLGQADIQFRLSALKVTLRRTDKGPVSVGMSAGLQATVEPSPGNVTYRWQPHPEMEFRTGSTPLEVPETRVGEVNAHFTKPGKVSLWVVVVDPKTGKTLGQSEPLEVTAGPPQLEIQVTPANPLVGQEAVARVVLPQGLEGATFRWLLPDQLKLVKQSQDAREITLFSRVTQAVELRVMALMDGEDLGTAQATLQARPFQVTAIQSTPKGTVEAGTRVGLVATLSPELKEKVSYRWRVNPGSILTSADFGQEVTVSRSQAGTLEATVIATDSRNVELGQARVSVAFSESPWRGLADKSRQLAAAGHFEEAAAVAAELAQKDAKLGSGLKKELAQKVFSAAQQSIQDEKFVEAMRLLKLARTLDPSDTRFAEESKRAGEFEARYRTVDRLIAELKDLASKRRFASAYPKVSEISREENLVPRLPKGNYRLAEAQQIYNQLERDYNAYWNAHMARREQLFQAKDYRGLVELCKGALAEWEHSRANDQDLRRGIRDYARLIQDPIAQSNQNAYAQYKAGNYEQAIASANQVIGSDPNYDRGGAWGIRALCHYAGNNTDGLLRDSEEFLKRRPQDAKAWALRGLALSYAQKNQSFDQQAKGYREAANHYGRAAELATDPQQSGRYRTQAAVNLERAQKTRPAVSAPPVPSLVARIEAPSHTMSVGGVIQSVGRASGGTPPYRYEWLINRKSTGKVGQVERWQVNTKGEFLLRVVVTDAAGRSAEASWPVAVVAAPVSVPPPPPVSPPSDMATAALTPGWDDSTLPLSSGKVFWRATPAANGRLNVVFVFEVQGAQPNHSFTAGIHFFAAPGVSSAPIKEFGGRMMSNRQETLSREGRTATIYGGWDFGALTTDGRGNGRAEFRYSVPNRRYAAQFTVRRGTHCPQQGSDCDAVFRTGGRFAGQFVTFGSEQASPRFSVAGLWVEQGENLGSLWTIQQSGNSISAITNQVLAPSGQKTSWAARNIRWDEQRRILSFDYYYTSTPPQGWETGSSTVHFENSQRAQVNWRTAHHSGTFVLQRH